MSVKRLIRDLAATAVAKLVPPGLVQDRRYFRLWESRGYHITPVHFYQPIPDTRVLDEGLWSRPSEMPGINLNEPKQLEFLAEVARDYRAEFTAPEMANGQAHLFQSTNTAFGPPDVEILHAMIRRYRPRRVVEIGSGKSTLLLARALLQNERENGELGELVAIEPYPNPVLKAGFPGLSRLIERKVQEVPMEEFTRLQANDVLFIDSSHVLTIGSDVWFEFLEILPRLAAGVLVHIHDIFLPFEYHKDWVMDRYFFWNEAYLLQAFLAFNDTFEILWAGSYMNYRHPKALHDAFPEFKKQQPGSFWIRRVR